VFSNVVDAVSWDIVWCSWVIGINISRFPVVSWPWVEVGQWSCFLIKLNNHVVNWIDEWVGWVTNNWLWSSGSWLSNLLGWGDTAVFSNVVDAVSWDIVWCSWVIGINISRFPVVSWPWVEVGQWGSFSIGLDNHVVDWVDEWVGWVSNNWLWTSSSWLGNLLGWSDTAVFSDVMDAVSWDIVTGSWVISINICRLPVIPWPWVEIRQWSSSTWNLSNHVVNWVNEWVGIVAYNWLWTGSGWLSNLFWWSDTTVFSNVMNAVSWDIIWGSWVISINISWFPVVSWPWVEVWQWSSFMMVMMFMSMFELDSWWSSKEGCDNLIFHFIN